MLHTLARKWFERDGLSVIKLVSKSLTNDRARSSILGPLLHMGVRADPLGTFELVVYMEGGEGNKIAEDVTRIWAGIDPESALNAINALKPSALRLQLLATAMQLWADRDPQAVLEYVEGMPKEIIALGLQLAIVAMAEDSPQQAAPLVAQLRGDSSKRNAIHKIAQIWLNLEPHAALDWILSDVETEEYRQELLSYALPSLALERPHLAFETALAQPLESHQTGLEAGVINRLAGHNLNIALELLPRVREGRTRLISYGVVSNAMVANGSPMEAVQLSQELPESDRGTYFLLTMGTWAQSDPDGLLDSIEGLPYSEAKSKAAAMLTFLNRFDEQTLTDDQLGQIEKFLSDEDAKTLEQGGMGLLNPIMNLQ